MRNHWSITVERNGEPLATIAYAFEKDQQPAPAEFQAVCRGASRLFLYMIESSDATEIPPAPNHRIPIAGTYADAIGVYRCVTCFRVPPCRHIPPRAVPLERRAPAAPGRTRQAPRAARTS